MRVLLLGYIALIIAGIVGWIKNIVQVFGLAAADAELGALFALKLVGIIVAPLGAVLGYIG